MRENYRKVIEIALFQEEKDSVKLLFWEWHSLLYTEKNECISISVMKGYLTTNLILGYHHKSWIPGVCSIWELQLMLMMFLLKKKNFLSICLQSLTKRKTWRMTVVTGWFELHFIIKFNYRFKFLKSISKDSHIEQQQQLVTGPYCHTTM